MMDGKSASEYLSKVTKDQNIEKLSDAELPTLTSIRKWFRSQIIQPILKLGYYNENTGKIVLGTKYDRYQYLKDFGAKVNAADTASAAATAYTFSTDVWIHWITASNADRAPKFQVDYTDGTTAITIREPSTNGVQTIQNALVGNFWPSAATIATINCPGPFMLPAGHTVTVTDLNFVADVMRKEICYTVLQ